MSETANFEYMGDAKMTLGGSHMQTIEITNIQHMIPINVTCTVDGSTQVVTAFIDYGTQEIVVSSEANPSIQDMESFKNSLSLYLANAEARMTEEMEVEVPSFEIPGYTLPTIPVIGEEEE